MSLVSSCATQETRQKRKRPVGAYRKSHPGETRSGNREKKPLVERWQWGGGGGGGGGW